MLPNTSLANQLLIAMPSCTDPNFSKSVIYVCEHHVQGTVGLIINRPMQYPLGPKDVLVTLGYVGWKENQLDQEILDNHWLVCPCKPELLYEVPFEDRWEYAGMTLGVKMDQLSSSAGHA